MHTTPQPFLPDLLGPFGMGITSTIGRAELAAITAAILRRIHGHTHIATGSPSSLHQIRKHVLHPVLHCHHVHISFVYTCTRRYLEDAHANRFWYHPVADLQFTTPCARAF